MAVKRTDLLHKVINPLIVSAMLGCIATALADMIHTYLATWGALYIAIGCTLAALEASYSRRLIKEKEIRGKDLQRFRAAEIGILLILVKIGSYIGDPWPAVVADIKTWPQHPLNLFTIEMLTASVLVLGAWLIATRTLRDLKRLDDPPEFYRDQITPKQAIISRFLWGGAILVIITGMSKIGLQALLNRERPPVKGLFLNVLLYFILGLILLGETQYVSLRRHWSAWRIKHPDKLAQRWVRYSLVFLILAAIVAFLLPTGYTVGLLAVSGYILRWLSLIIVTVFQVLLFLLSFPLWWLMSLFLSDPPPAPPQMPDLGPQSQPEPPAVTSGAGWLDILRSLAFWVVGLAILGFILRTYLRDHPEIIQFLTSWGPFRLARKALAALWRWLGGVKTAIEERLPRGLPLRRRQKGGIGERLRRFFRLGALSPRERTLYYYLSILRRAKRKGLPRRQSQTPYEYDETIKPHLKNTQKEMDLLTEDFVEARYSQHPIEEARERQTRTRWKRVRAAIRALKRENK